MVGYGLDLAERYRNLPYIAEYIGPKPRVTPTAAPRRTAVVGNRRAPAPFVGSLVGSTVVDPEVDRT